MSEEQKNESQKNQPQPQEAKPQESKPAAQPGGLAGGKKKPCNCFRNIALTIIIILIVISLAFEMYGGKGIKMAIETAGTKVLKVSVTLDDVDLQPFGGKLELDDLVVANPEGFETETLLELGEANVKLNTASLLSDTIEIEYIKLDGINFTLEQKGLTSNLQTILDSLPKSEKAETKQEPEKASKKLHIGLLEITNVTVNAKVLPIPGQLDKITLKLPDIKKTDIGGEGEESVDTQKLITMIIEMVSEAIAKAGAGVLPDNLTDGLNQVLGQLPGIDDITDLAGGTVENATEILKDATDIGQDAVENVGKGLEEGIKGLFNKKE